MATHYQGLVDAHGRPIEKKTMTTAVAVPTVGSVRSPLTGYPAEGLTPPRLSAILKEADQGQPLRFYELAEQIEERDMHYAAVLGVRKRSVAQIDISVEPAGEDADSKAQAQMIEDWLTRDELADELFEMLDAIGKGESFTEINWDSSEGEWRPQKLEWRDPRWFRPDRVNLTTPRLIMPDGTDSELPGGKFVHLVARGKSGLPARSGLARLAAWFWLFKGMTVRDLAIHNATFGQPLRLGKYGPNASEADKETLFQAVARIAGDCAAIIPASMTIEFPQPPAAAGTALYLDTANWLDQQLSKATLGQTTTTDAISGGHAVSKEHRQVQEDIERADAKALSAAINRDLVRTWIDLQYGPQEKYPRIRIARPDEEDLKQLSDSLAKLVPLGLKVGQREIRSKFGLSEPEGAEEVLVAPKPAPVAAPGAEEEEKSAPKKDEAEVEVSAHAEQNPGAARAAAAAAAVDRLAVDGMPWRPRRWTCCSSSSGRRWPRPARSRTCGSSCRRWCRRSRHATSPWRCARRRWWRGSPAGLSCSMVRPIEPRRSAVRFSEAIEFLRRRLAIGADEWLRILGEEGASSSAIADDLVRTITEELAAAALEMLESGGTLSDFQASYDAIVAKHGWTYKGDSGWHSRLVFRLHVGMAQAAGRWEQAQRLAAANPSRQVYMRYVTAGDHRVRPEHQEWDGVILVLEHPFWLTHWPPNGFNCRCHVQVVTDIDLRRYGWSVTPDGDPRLAVAPDPGWGFNPGVSGGRTQTDLRDQVAGHYLKTTT